MASKTSNVVKYLLFVGLAMLLLWLAFRKTDPTELWESLRHADYRYVILSMLMGYAAYISRGMRWLLLLETMNYKPRSWASIHSVAIGYFANMAVPRAGEVARCTSLNKLEDIPVSKLFGTVIVERTIDFIMLVSFVSGALFTSYSTFTEFFSTATGNTQSSDTPFFQSPVFFILLAGLAFFFFLYLFRNLLTRQPFYAKIRSFLAGVWEGFQAVFKMKKKLAFILHTLFIWIMYYLMVYVVIFAIPETQHLSPSNMLFVMVAAGMGMVVPVPGGVGAYHYLVVLSLGLLGISDTVGLSFATLVHSGQSVMAIITGVIAMLYIYYRKRKSLLA